MKFFEYITIRDMERIALGGLIWILSFHFFPLHQSLFAYCLGISSFLMLSWPLMARWIQVAYFRVVYRKWPEFKVSSKD